MIVRLRIRRISSARRAYPVLAALTLAVAMLIAPTGPAEAACACRCVDGKATSVCSSGTDIPKLCTNTRCPLKTPKPTPMDVSKPKPQVKPGCKVRQVYNPQTGKHEWGQLCH